MARVPSASLKLPNLKAIGRALQSGGEGLIACGPQPVRCPCKLATDLHLESSRIDEFASGLIGQIFIRSAGEIVSASPRDHRSFRVTIATPTLAKSRIPPNAPPSHATSVRNAPSAIATGKDIGTETICAPMISSSFQLKPFALP